MTIHRRFPFSLDAERGLLLPEQTQEFTIPAVGRVSDPAAAIAEALGSPIGEGARTIAEIVRSKGRPPGELSACVVVSDTTRPVPYRGASGILLPIVEALLEQGVLAEHITVLIATGTHRALTQEEIDHWFDPQVLSYGIRFLNHDCTDSSNLTDLGETSRGSRIRINSIYVHSDIKLLTGLVEGHFMAGFSGGRKSICPGLIGRESTFIFHGYPMLSHRDSTSLRLEGNPCHQEALEMALRAGADAILNVTLDHELELTGVFYGDLQRAHEAAARFLRSYTRIEVQEDFDVVVIHAGFVGVNHYQCAKAAVEAAKICRPGGCILLVADVTDPEHIGSIHYRSVLSLLTCIGPQGLKRLFTSPDWTFVPEQWQVQKWIEVFEQVAPEHFFFYAPEFTESDYELIPHQRMASCDCEGFQDAIDEGLAGCARLLGRPLGELRIAYLSDGPYGIVERK